MRNEVHMLRLSLVSFVLLLPLILTCRNSDDPFADRRNARGEIELHSSTGEWTDDIFSDSTQNQVTVSGRLFLSAYIDSGFVTLRYENGDCDTILKELWAEGDKDNRSVDTVSGVLLCTVILFGACSAE